jgi:hypothetical protein
MIKYFIDLLSTLKQIEKSLKEISANSKDLSECTRGLGYGRRYIVAKYNEPVN